MSFCVMHREEDGLESFPEVRGEETLCDEGKLPEGDDVWCKEAFSEGAT